MVKKIKVEQVISISDDDLDGILTPQDDPLVIKMIVANYEVNRVLVDNGSLTNILFYEDFQQIKLGDERLKPISTSLYGFVGNEVHIEGSIELLVIVGTVSYQITSSISLWLRPLQPIMTS